MLGAWGAAKVGANTRHSADNGRARAKLLDIRVKALTQPDRNVSVLGPQLRPWATLVHDLSDELVMARVMVSHIRRGSFCHSEQRRGRTTPGRGIRTSG